MSLKRKVDESCGDDQASSKKMQSSWLGRFLCQKREAIVLAPPDATVTDDTYLKEFCSQFHHKQVADNVSDNEDDDWISNSISATGISSIPGEGTLKSETPDNYEDLTIAANGQIRIFNLPYNIDTEKITKTGLKLGIAFLKVTIEICKTTNLPTGAASVELAPGVEAVAAVLKLQGEDFGGRLVRVQSDQQRKRRGSRGRSDRYFIGDDMKCKNCGQVGHILKNCTERGAHPCHLCAGKDHEAVNCPNITCFRCGDFGHHSKTCIKARKYSKAVICTLCASCYHDSRECNVAHDQAKKRLEDSSIRCMRCNQLGHAVCEPVLKVTLSLDEEIESVVHCPNCGQEGHHVDFPSLSTGGDHNFNACVAPKFDAYLRFPILLGKLENNTYLTGQIEDKQVMYHALVQSAGSSDAVTKMFPSLRRGWNSNGTPPVSNIQPVLPFPSIPQRRTGQEWGSAYRGYSHGLNNVYPNNYDFDTEGIPYVDDSVLPQSEAVGCQADTYRALYTGNQITPKLQMQPCSHQQHPSGHQQQYQQQPQQLQQEQYHHPKQPPLPPQPSCPSYHYNGAGAGIPYVDDSSLPQCEAATYSSLYNNNTQQQQQQQQFEQQQSQQQQRYEQQLQLEAQQQAERDKRERQLREQREQEQQQYQLKQQRQQQQQQLREQERLQQEREKQRLQQIEQQRLQVQLEKQRALQAEQQRSLQLEQQRMERLQAEQNQKWQQQHDQRQQPYSKDSYNPTFGYQDNNNNSGNNNNYQNTNNANNNGYHYNDQHDRRMHQSQHQQLHGQQAQQQPQQQQQQSNQYLPSSGSSVTRVSNPYTASAAVFRGSNGSLVNIASGITSSSVTSMMSSSFSGNTNNRQQSHSASNGSGEGHAQHSNQTNHSYSHSDSKHLLPQLRSQSYSHSNGHSQSNSYPQSNSHSQSNYSHSNNPQSKTQSNGQSSSYSHFMSQSASYVHRSGFWPRTAQYHYS